MVRGLELEPDPTATSTTAAPLGAALWRGAHIRLHFQQKGVPLQSLKRLACMAELVTPVERPPAPSDLLMCAVRQ